MLTDGLRLKFRLGGPIVQPDHFLYLAAFVPVFLGLGRSLLGLAEGVFGVAYGIVDQVQRLSHRAFFFDRIAVVRQQAMLFSIGPK